MEFFLLSTLGASNNVTVQLQSTLDALALQFNTSYSFAFKHGDEEVAVAAGWASHAPGAETNATVNSLYPAGSVTKTFLAASLLQLSAAGQIDLDRAAASYIDPWNAAQGVPSVEEQWGGNASASAFSSNVTVRTLMGMRSGLRDYHSSALRKWTREHPDKDILPQTYIEQVDKAPYFPPNAVGRAAYSSDGYVLLGMVLAAVQGAKSWGEMNQSAALDWSHAPLLRHPRDRRWTFMGAGPCSLHPLVVHQYAL